MVVTEQAAASRKERASGGLKSFMTEAPHNSRYQWSDDAVHREGGAAVRAAEGQQAEGEDRQPLIGRKITVSVPSIQR